MKPAHPRRTITLTRRGERLLVAAYTALCLAGALIVLLAALGFAGWIETGGN